MQQPFKGKALTHIKKAEGMLKKVRDMIEKDSYCIDVLQQSLAAMGFIKSANKTIFENHLNSCFKAGMNSNQKKQQKLIEELTRVINKA